jgi:hypothetical protein
MCGLAATGAGSESEALSKGKQRHGIGGIMKLSIEAKVAAAVATAFVALTVGAIGQEHSEGQTGGLNGYGLTNNPAVNMYLSEQGSNSSLIGRTNAEAGEGN